MGLAGSLFRPILPCCSAILRSGHLVYAMSTRLRIRSTFGTSLEYRSPCDVVPLVRVLLNEVHQFLARDIFPGANCDMFDIALIYHLVEGGVADAERFGRLFD